MPLAFWREQAMARDRKRPLAVSVFAPYSQGERNGISQTY
jgi:hypothetical protein